MGSCAEGGPPHNAWAVVAAFPFAFAFALALAAGFAAAIAASV